MKKVSVLFLAMVLVLSTFTACDIGNTPEHRHTNIIDDAVAPTCTSTGLTAGAHCSECGEIIIKQEIVPVSSEHTFDDRYDAVCNVCGHTRDVGCQHLIIETLPAKEATCTETGLTAGKGCSVCGESFTQQIIPAKGHKDGKWITDKEATETETGKKHQICAVCGETFREVTVPVLGTLEYTVDGTSCTVTGIGSFTDAALYIPEYIDGHKVTAIGAKAFADQTQLTAIIIPNTVKSIEARAFYGCTGLTEITIPASVTSIGTQIFYKASNLSTVYYNSTYQNSDNPFLNLAHITKIVFGGKSIPSNILANILDGNTFVKEVVIADGVKSIGNYAFYNCSSLTSIVIPDSVTSIGDYAFQNCSSLTSIVIPDSVTSIGYGAFGECSRLTSIVIPDSVTSICEGAFFNCSSLESIVVEQGNTVYHSAGNCLIKTASKTLIAGCKNSIIPTDGSVTSIGAVAFEGCSSLTSIKIPDSVTSIDYGAFSGCSSLTSIVIPDSVMSIATSAFSGCSSLTSIVIPDSVTSIGEWAFADCSSLTSIVIPDSVTSIRGSAFRDCSSLTSVYITDIEAWLNIGFWSYDSNPCCNGADLYLNNEKLTEVVIPDSVTSIRNGAFYGCRSLTSVKLPDSVTSIGNWAFYYCSSLTSVTFEGTKAQWNAISKEYDWNYNTGNYTVHCTDGDIRKY